jgi:hypothetical protein
LPKISFSNLPTAILDHLKARAADRSISLAELRSLERWKATDPQAPEGNWYKDFGSFLFCGTSELPKTILAKGMRPYGQEID